MNSITARQAMVGALLVVALGALGCSESAPNSAGSKSSGAAGPASESRAKHTIEFAGYPIPRGFENMIRMPGVDTIVVVTGAAAGEPRFTGPATPGDDWDAPGDFIMTPVDATVASVFRGPAQVGDQIRMTLNGGRIGEYEAIADTEVSAQLDDIAQYSRLVVAGQTVESEEFGQVLEPWFVYGISGDGRAKSLMDSFGGTRPGFAMATLRGTDLPGFKPIPERGTTGAPADNHG
jgi:hypothetical protein